MFFGPAEDPWVIEKNPKEGDFLEHAADKLIPQADVVAITGTALTNHTLEHLLELCNPWAYVLILGDTAPLSPLFFEYGVDAVCGTAVVDTEQALRCVSQGATFRQIKGTKRLALQKQSSSRSRDYRQNNSRRSHDGRKCDSTGREKTINLHGAGQAAAS